MTTIFNELFLPLIYALYIMRRVAAVAVIIESLIISV